MVSNKGVVIKDGIQGYVVKIASSKLVMKEKNMVASATRGVLKEVSNVVLNLFGVKDHVTIDETMVAGHVKPHTNDPPSHTNLERDTAMVEVGKNGVARKKSDGRENVLHEMHVIERCMEVKDLVSNAMQS
ncbi:hypothetical protein REPUB_Repub17cG0079400 [Reevesia pubescens]